jgi:hypothetical protein
VALAVTSALLPSWLLRRTHRESGLLPGPDPDSVRWKSFRAASRATAYYSEYPPQRQSVLELADYYRNSPRFLNPAIASISPDPAPLAAPWDPPFRAIALEPWFRLEDPIDVLMSPAVESLVTARPDVMAGTVTALHAVAVSALRHRWRLPSLSHGIIAFTGCSRAPLTEGHRDELWGVFGVPVFEQFRGFLGEILAAECEAHHGLHVNPEIAVWEHRPGPDPEDSRRDGVDAREFLVTSLANLRHPAYRLATGYHGIFDYRTCGCGLATPRICWTRARRAALSL